MVVVAGVLLLLVLLVRRRGRGERVISRQRMRQAASQKTAAAPAASAEAVGPEVDDALLLETPAKNSIEVAEADPLAEAAVYLEFGYLDHAAQALRGYVDGVGGENRDVLRKLLQIYLQLGRVDDYADVLELLANAGESHEIVQAALLEGLAADVENLHLRVVAESFLGLGPEQLGKLLGADIVLEDYTKAEEGDRQLEPEPATAPASESPSVAVAGTPKPLRQVMRLLDGGVRLPSSFSQEEKAMLRVFTHPAYEARLYRAEARMHSTAGNLEAAMEALRRAIAARPQALVNFADLLWVLHRRKLLDEYVRTLWQLYRILDGAGRALRDRFLGMGLVLGAHPILECLMQSPGRGQLDEIGRRFGLMPPEPVAAMKIQLVDSVRQESMSSLPSSGGGDVLDEVNSYLDFGQIDQAIDVLEAAILEAPADARLYPTLLDLYDRMDELDRLMELSAKVRRLVQRPPEEVVPMMISLQQRLQQRKQRGRRTKG